MAATTNKKNVTTNKMTKEEAVEKIEKMKDSIGTDSMIVASKIEAAIAENAEKAKEVTEKAVEKAKEVTEKNIEKAKEEVKKNAEKTAEKAADTVKKATEEVKKTTAKKATAAKKTVAKKAEEVKAEAKKKVTRKPAKTVVLQYEDIEIDESVLTERAIAQFGAMEGSIAVKDITLYLKPEDRAAYYVINGQYTGKVEF